MTALLEYLDLFKQSLKTPGAAVTFFGLLNNSTTICSGM